jgi:hypothetical protein
LVLAVPILQGKGGESKEKIDHRELRLGSNVDLRVGESRLHRGSFVSGDEGITGLVRAKL